MGSERAAVEYQDFLSSKTVRVEKVGREISEAEVNPALRPFQRAITAWAVRQGRAAIFSDCGTGKTPMQLEWAKQVGGRTLILAPLAVAHQTIREGKKFGYEVAYARRPEDAGPGMTITNYELVERFDLATFDALVLDESSILKSYDGKFRKLITTEAQKVKYRLACTATPAPNDTVEIINHAEYLGVMRGKEIIALFFTQDGNTTHSWRLKGHAKKDFWHWLATWAVALRKPSDLGFSDKDFELPQLRIEQHRVKAERAADALFALEAGTLQERQAARRASVSDRVALCAKLVRSTPGSWVVWCNLNQESEDLVRAIKGAVEIRGSHTPQEKEKSLLSFSEGSCRVLITKPSIAGFGMNWQHCANQAFVGISDSFEDLYQAIRRAYRHGQQQSVRVYFPIVRELEGDVFDNIRRKEAEFERSIAEMEEAYIAARARLKAVGA